MRWWRCFCVFTGCHPPDRRLAAGDVSQFGISPAPFLRGYDMLETTLTQLERLVTDLLQQNRTQSESINRLEQELMQAKEENDSLQLAAMAQEEQQASMLARLQALVQRGGVSAEA